MSSDDATAAQPVVEESPPAATRERLVRQFEQWVDRMLAGEPPPQGLPEELLADADAIGAGAAGSQQQCDLYTLFAALTTLTGEIRLQGRAFKQLGDTLAPLAEVPQQLDRLQNFAERQTPTANDLTVSGREVCEVMLDLYDRLARGLQTCDSAIGRLPPRKPGWLRRWTGLGRRTDQAAASVEAIRDATALTLARLEAALHEWGVERIGQVGDDFDPARMTVVQVRPSSEFEPLTVIEVNRSGYALNGQVRATAQVTVARADSMAGQTTGEG